MSSLEVMFYVPEQIQIGLDSGLLQRIGGVIVDRSTKQVVAWLRDGAAQHLKDDLLPQSFTSIFAAANGQINLSNVFATFTMGGQVLNLAITAITYQAMMQRLELLSEDVRKLGDTIRTEFARDRLIEFEVALEAARDILEQTQPGHLDHTLRGAVDGLYKARQHFLHDFQNQLRIETPDTSTLILAQHYLTLATFAEVTRLRCFLTSENESPEKVRDRLGEHISLFGRHGRDLVRHWLGKSPAIYFHRSIESMDLWRFLNVQQWLRLGDSPYDMNPYDLLFQITDDLRSDFWNNDITHLVEDEYGFPRRIIKTSAEKINELKDGLAHAEVIIENYERLVGFDLELRSLRLSTDKRSFQEWSRLISDTDIQEHGIGMIIDRDLLDRLTA